MKFILFAMHCLQQTKKSCFHDCSGEENQKDHHDLDNNSSSQQPGQQFLLATRNVGYDRTLLQQVRARKSPTSVMAYEHHVSCSSRNKYDTRVVLLAMLHEVSGKEPACPPRTEKKFLLLAATRTATTTPFFQPRQTEYS